jgi:nicotinamide-nucleotide amidase
MNIELITIGTELLLGFTIDTNGAELARTLGAIGVRVVRRTSVGDEPGAIGDAIDQALARTGAVVTTGGLGPTRDDITKNVVAELLARPLEWSDEVWEQVLARYARLGRAPVESNRTQAMVPRGATVLPNRWGTAPGLWIDDERGVVIMLPGVPREMSRLLEHEVVPRLLPRGAGTAVRSATVRTTGVPESTLAERLGEIEPAISPLTLAYLPGVDGVDLRLTAWDMTPAEAAERLDEAAARLRSVAGDASYGGDDADLAAVVLDAARTRGCTLAVAESCTGGLLGGRLTAVPGSSDVFLGGVICYADEAKTELAGVPPALIAEHGAVSEAVACAMAAGTRARLGAGVAVAVTGVAGPGGGTAEKPVGTVWFATAGASVTARKVMFGGERDEIRARAAQTALFLMLKAVSALPAR